MIQKGFENICPDVSVIIPLYKNRETIARAIDSVLSQTIQSFEIIVVVDDGSIDDGGEGIVKSYTDSRIRLIRQENRGVSSARNYGVDMAKSDLIAFLDADDEWLPGFLETILKLRSLYPKAGLYGTGYIVKSLGSERVVSYNRHYKYQEISNYFKVVSSDLNGSVMLCLTSGMAIPKSIYQEVGGHPIGYVQSEDRCLRGKIALDYTVAYAPETQAIYNMDVQTYNSRFTQYITDPFADYIDSYDYNDLQKRVDVQWIMLFADQGRLFVTRENLFHGHDHKEIRTTLNRIQSPALLKKKRILFLESYIPTVFLQYGRLVWRQRKLFIIKSKE